MPYTLMFAICAVPLTLGIAMIVLFRKSKFTIALFGFMLSISVWQLDVAVLYSYGILSLETIDFLFRLFRFGTVMLAPALLTVAYIASREMSSEGVIDRTCRLVLNKYVVMAFYLWSVIVYLAGWSDKGIKDVHLIENSSTNLLYPTYGEWGWTFKLYLILLLISILISLFASLKVTDLYLRSFLILFVWAMVVTYLIGILNMSEKTIAFSSGIAVMLHSIVIFVAFIRMHANMIREMNASLLGQKDFLRKIIDMNPNFIYAKDWEGKFILANLSLAKLYGTTPEQLLGKSEADLNPNREEVLKNLQEDREVMKSFQKKFTPEETFIDPQGNVRWVQTAKIPIISSNRKQILCVSTDITERKQIEEALTEAETKYRSLVEGSLVGVYIYQNGRFSYVNPRYAEIFGYTQQEILEMDVMDLLLPDDRPLAAEYFQKSVGGEMKSMRYQVRGVKKDRTVIETEVYGSTTVYKGIPAIIGTLLDITEHKKTEELLRKSDKLSVVGELAAGVAHEIRNPLTALKGFVQLLQAKIDDNEKYFTIMLSELERIELIVNEFLVLAKPQAMNFQQKDVRVLLRSIVALLETQAILNNVQIKNSFEPDIPLIKCEENQLKQVFLNVLKNSIEAMPHGGNIEIRIQMQEQDKVLIRFIDQGCGIPEERIQRLGEPFYTTKEKGTGLGLMISYKIIEAHKGSIQIESELNKGTCVNIVLPVA
ncbi:PAS domain S-box protein [Effusibacillus consociatus]|uniref:histidine kinase n=1 Tax=Effusibacillus consociatus TaxID=1117041 RepID=A0ABV9Q6P4_9BACL